MGPDEENLDCNDLEIARELNSMDALGIHIGDRVKEDQLAVDHYNKTMHIDPESGAYVVGFPWVSDTPPKASELESNYRMVLCRFKATMAKLDKDKAKLLQYTEVHNKEVKN